MTDTADIVRKALHAAVCDSLELSCIDLLEAEAELIEKAVIIVSLTIGSIECRRLAEPENNKKLH